MEDTGKGRTRRLMKRRLPNVPSFRSDLLIIRGGILFGFYLACHANWQKRCTKTENTHRHRHTDRGMQQPISWGGLHSSRVMPSWASQQVDLKLSMKFGLTGSLVKSLHANMAKLGWAHLCTHYLIFLHRHWGGILIKCCMFAAAKTIGTGK